MEYTSNNLNLVCVLGLGYIGLPTAATLASRGIAVIGVDINQHVVDTVAEGKIHIIEPELDIAVRSAVGAGYLRATTKPEPANVFIIAVPTPFKENHIPDLSYVKAAAQAISGVLQKGNLVILESTSPVGTTEKIAQWLAEARPDLTFPHQVGEDADICIAYCPERVMPGNVIRELVNNDRIIGGMSSKCARAAVNLYKNFVQGECLVTSVRTAEMCKLTENASRDVNIAFANELSIICEDLKINVWELIRLANRHPRVNILRPGPGVGGHCIAVDPWFIINSSPNESRLMQAARAINDEKPLFVVNQVVQAARRFKNPVIACLGLSFKADIDDLRESPALEIVSQLVSSEIGRIIVHEPHINRLPPLLSGKCELHDIDYSIDHADILVLLVPHSRFRSISLERLHKLIVIDTSGIWTNVQRENP